LRRGAMADAASSIEEELEALEALYPDDGLVVRRAGAGHDDSSGASATDDAHHTTVSLDVAPRTLDDETQQYVRATLKITLDNDYPANPPTVRLVRVCGLDDTRQAEVIRRLDGTSRDFAAPNEPILALLCETAFETLTELNRPDGDCAFCLEPVADVRDSSHPLDSRSVGARGTFMKLARCYHCFHERCFKRWWRWKTRADAEAAKGRGAHRDAASGSDARARTPTHLCPVCRVAIEEEDVRHVDLDADDESDEDVEETVSFDAGGQTRRRRFFETAIARQKSKGGLIEEGAGEGILVTPGARASDFVRTSCAEQSETTGSVPKPRGASGPKPKPIPIPKPNPIPIPKPKPKPKLKPAEGGLGWLKTATEKTAASSSARAIGLDEGIAALDVREGPGRETCERGRGGRGRGGPRALFGE